MNGRFLRIIGIGLVLMSIVVAYKLFPLLTDSVMYDSFCEATNYEYPQYCLRGRPAEELPLALVALIYGIGFPVQLILIAILMRGFSASHMHERGMSSAEEIGW